MGADQFDILRSGCQNKAQCVIAGKGSIAQGADFVVVFDKFNILWRNRSKHLLRVFRRPVEFSKQSFGNDQRKFPIAYIFKLESVYRSPFQSLDG